MSQENVEIVREAIGTPTEVAQTGPGSGSQALTTASRIQTSLANRANRARWTICGGETKTVSSR